ncbi:hypothetical protein Gogos_015614, partial [Gossypium gossypioides]|nr:hypothetical protein [Gossypium gossypioides]
SYLPAIIHLTCHTYILRGLKRVVVKNVEGKSLVLPLLDLTCGSSVSGQLPKDQEPLRFKDGKKKTIFHYSHRHELGFFKYRKVCGDKIPRTLSHPFHPKHPLRLAYTYQNRNCNVCSKDKVASGKVPSSSPPPVENKALFVEQNEESNVIRTLSLFRPITRPHQMYEVTEELKGENYCSGCRMVLNGSSYFSLTTHKIGVLEEKMTGRVTELHHFTHPHKLVLTNCNDRRG